MSAHDLGFSALSGARPPEMTGSIATTGTAIAVGLIGIPLVLAVGGFGYLLYKANKDPDSPEQEAEDIRRVSEEAGKTGMYGAVTETLAVAKNRKTMKTPFGVRVPNLARYMLPEAEQTRALSGAYASLKGAPR